MFITVINIISTLFESNFSIYPNNEYETRKYGIYLFSRAIMILLFASLGLAFLKNFYFKELIISSYIIL